MDGNRAEGNAEASVGAPIGTSPTDLSADPSPMPLYHRVYVILRSRIVSGDFPVGAILPGENDLARSFGVSRITAKRALDELAAEGLVERGRGRGTRVRRRASGGIAARPISASIEGLLAALNAIGRDTSVQLLEFGYLPAAASVADRLKIEPQQIVQRAVRVRHLDGAPLSQSTTFVPERIGRRFTEADLIAAPLIDLLERAGVRVGAAEQSITATLADSQVAPRLQVAVGSPLLLIRRVVSDSGGIPVQAIDILYRPDRFEYHMTLSRGPSAASTIQESVRHD
ncbi:MAG TPA: GntR family transcriptional regulator [Acetobacteraceae bacterium]|nr:GntR family transcriptional regulator [Acetobacteraceae bacterium]